MCSQGKIVLCADSESLMRPWMMGLDGMDVESFDWVIPFSEADEARRFMTSGTDIDEVWVVSSNDVESVNLAAAIRKDDPSLAITLILAKPSGSILSRASSAGIKTVYTTYEFAERFAIEVQRRRRLGEVDSLGYEDVITTIRKRESKRRALDVPRVEDVKKLKRASSVKRPDAHGERSGFIIGIFSGSGGVGKSVTAALSGLIYAHGGSSVLLIDGDIQFGDLASILGRRGAPTMDDALEDRTIIEGLVRECQSGAPALIAASKHPENSDELDRHLGELLSECSRRFDVVIVDTGSYWKEGHAALLEACDCAIFMMDQRASSVRSNNRAQDLCQRMGVATNTFVNVLNRCDKKALFSPLDIAGVMNGAHIFELKDGGIDIEESCGAGCAEELIDVGNPFVSSLKAMLAEIHPVGQRMKRGNAKGSKNPKDPKDPKDPIRGCVSQESHAEEMATRSLSFGKRGEGRRRRRRFFDRSDEAARSKPLKAMWSKEGAQ